MESVGRNYFSRERLSGLEIISEIFAESASRSRRLKVRQED